MKLLALSVFVLPLVVSCDHSLPPVPPSRRAVVQPSGSSENAKPWNQTTQKEGEAVLGPLSNMRR